MLNKEICIVCRHNYDSENTEEYVRGYINWEWRRNLFVCPCFHAHRGIVLMDKWGEPPDRCSYFLEQTLNKNRTGIFSRVKWRLIGWLWYIAQIME